jgi:hypothetical protein
MKDTCVLNFHCSRSGDGVSQRTRKGSQLVNSATAAVCGVETRLRKRRSGAWLAFLDEVFDLRGGWLELASFVI